MSDAAYLNEEATRAKRLRKPFVKLNSRLHEMTSGLGQQDPELTKARQEEAGQEMQRIAAMAAATLEHSGNAVQAANRALRGFQAENRLTRPLNEPDTLKTLLLLMIGWLVETIFTATGLFADGHVDLIPALGFAVTFSTVNIGIGLAAGFALRFVNYRQNAVMWTSEIRWIRWAARSAFGLLVLTAMLMIFTGGRVRVTGGHDAIFGFSTVSFGATFNDGLALVVMVAAALSVALSVAKGFSGFADPVPGYSAHASAGQAIIEAAEDQVEESLESIAEIAEDAEDEISDGFADPDKVKTLFEAILRFNGRVDEDRAHMAVIAEETWQRDCHVAGSAVARNPVMTPVLDALELDAAALDGGQATMPNLDRLRAARLEANATIADAHNAFLAKVSAARAPYSPTTS